jgi:deoxycytidine triphosphate deaminase/intein/homing endonuclease
VILSDHSIKEELAAGRIQLDPSDETFIQPASVDVRLDRYFRVFLNHTMSVIDVKKNLEELTRLVEIDDDRAFVLHPGEFVLGSTLERVALPDDLVARIEGKSSLGRLGLLIHSSLPAGEELLVRDPHGVRRRTIGEIVKEQLPCEVVGFDPDTFEVGYHEVTGFYEGPEDKIYEVQLASGRRVRVTAGHNLFTIGDDGDLRKVRTAELATGVMVAVPRDIPDPPDARAVIDLRQLVPEEAWGRLLVQGPTIERALADDWPTASAWLIEAGLSPTYYRQRGQLPWPIAEYMPGVHDALGAADFVRGKGERHRLPLSIEVDVDLAWTLGMYVAEGHRRDKQVNIANTDQARLDRLQATFASLGIPVHRSDGSVTCCSKLLSDVFAWMDMGGLAPTKRVPSMVFGWPTPLVEAFLGGLVDGDGSVAGGRTSVWTTSEGLVSDVLLLFARLGKRAGSTCKTTANLPLWQVYAPDNEHKLLTTAPLSDVLLRRLRDDAGLSQIEASRRAGYSSPTDLNNLERRSGRDAIRFATIRRLAAAYADAGVDTGALDRLVDGGLAWDRVARVVDTGEYERIYDIEVRPDGRKIQNFLAGRGGVFVANTAGFIDAGWDGHITLELSNVANLPITLYPGMKIGQISFLRMTTAADVPYGQGSLKSKYQGQRGPTPSRYWENFDED